MKELSSELSTFKAKQEEAEKRSTLDSRAAARDHTTALREQTMRANAAEQAKAKAKVAAAAAELQRKLHVQTTDLLNSQDKRASTARACQQEEETIRSLEERVKELSSELSTFKAK